MPFAADDAGGRVVVEQIDPRRWRLAEALVYHGDTDTFTVPEGYVTDFASVPRIAIWLIPVFGNYTRAAILHDYLLTDVLGTGRVTSTDVDGLFRRVMRELGVPVVKRWLMWTGVRWGALFNAKRRRGWAASAPAVLGITVLALPLAAPMIADALGMVYYGAAEFVATGGRHKGTTST